ncbi:helix-turn-helix domain-containing protein [Paraburkholderia sp.]|uniref:helix-turn-helix domain-containing protein n=1 Tax=Paraburkholderia sp. TaxID=1926495 RepID=UPI0039C9318C
MDQLEAIRTFLEVARSGSITAAATRLAVSIAMVSRHVKGLETQLGTGCFPATRVVCRLQKWGRCTLIACISS